MSININIENEFAEILRDKRSWVAYGSYKDNHTTEQQEEALKILDTLIEVFD